MSAESWEIQATAAVVRVDHDTIQIRSTVRQRLAGQRARWRAGDRRGLLRLLWVLFGSVLFVGYLSYTAYRVLDVGVAGPGVVGALSLVSTLWALWYGYLRTETIPLSALERVSIDESRRELSITYDADATHAFPAWLYDLNAGTKSLTLPSEEAVCDARETCQLRGISVESSDDSATETVHRFDVENGVYYCESCGGQVSPADSTCPSCGYGLRVEVSDETPTDQPLRT